MIIIIIRGAETRWCSQPHLLVRFAPTLKSNHNYNLSSEPNERFNFGRAVTSPEARLDFKAGGVWSRGVTPLVLGTNVGMGADCNCFLKRLAEKLSEKNEEPYHTTIAWIRKLLSSEILRSVHTCVRGSRTPFCKIPQGDFIDDCRLNATQACVIMA